MKSYEWSEMDTIPVDCASPQRPLTGARGSTHPGHVPLHKHLAVEPLALVRAQRHLQLRAREGEQLVPRDLQLPLRRVAETFRLEPLHHFIRIWFLKII